MRVSVLKRASILIFLITAFTRQPNYYGNYPYYRKAEKLPPATTISVMQPSRGSSKSWEKTYKAYKPWKNLCVIDQHWAPASKDSEKIKPPILRSWCSALKVEELRETGGYWLTKCHWVANTTRQRSDVFCSCYDFNIGTTTGTKLRTVRVFFTAFWTKHSHPLLICAALIGSSTNA